MGAKTFGQIARGRGVLIKKTDDDKRLVFGWASVAALASGEAVVDWQQDVIPAETLEAAVYEYVLNFRASGDNHERGGTGRLVESVVFTKEKAQAIGIPDGYMPEGWWIGVYIDDDEVWQKVKDGTYTMFSIEGTAQRVPAEV